MDWHSLPFHPRILDLRRGGYGRAQLLRDVAGGVTVGVIALPLAMAFAIASGVKPEAGLITAIIGGFLVSALGGSRVQIGGPAGAFIVIVYGIIERYGLANLLIATMFAGVLLFAMGMLRLGSLVRLIPVPIVIGFTNGIAALIALSQVRDLLGLRIDKMPGEMFAMLHALGRALPSVSWPTVALSGASLLLLFAWPPLARRCEAQARLRWLAGMPGPILVLIAATLANVALGLGSHGVATIGSRFGGIPATLPAPTLPDFDWTQVRTLFAPALTVALLSAIESLLCARVADGLSGDRHDPNQELMAQGLANFASPMFGGMPVTGTIARTVANIRSGSGSPIAGIVHALTLLLIVLIAAPLASDVPLAALAAILMHVAWNMGEWREFARLRHFSMHYRTLLVGTFVLTVVFDLSVAVEVGLALACLFFIYRMSTLTQVDPLPLPAEAGLPPHAVRAYRLYGSLFFAAAGKIEALADPALTPGEAPRVVILELRQLVSMDTTGAESLANLHRSLAGHGATLVLCEINPQPGSLLRRSSLLAQIGEDNCCATLADAVRRAGVLLAAEAAPGSGGTAGNAG